MKIHISQDMMRCLSVNSTGTGVSEGLAVSIYRVYTAFGLNGPRLLSFYSLLRSGVAYVPVHIVSYTTKLL